MAVHAVVIHKKDIRASRTQPCALNPTALKSIRDFNENPPGWPKVNRVDLFEPLIYEIKTLHRTRGMAYELRDPMQPWSWRRMLNAMDEPTLERVVGVGIVGIRCQPIYGYYDHSRSHAAKQLYPPVYGDATVPI